MPDFTDTGTFEPINNFKSRQEESSRQDNELDTNLAESSGFESLQDDLTYRPSADNISKSLSMYSGPSRVRTVQMDSRLKRGRELMELVKLTSVKYSLYANPSINYEVFLKLFGRKNVKQVQVQTHDRSECEVQTELSIFQDKAVQHPHLSGSLMEQQMPDADDKSSCTGDESGAHCDPFKLSTFLIRAEKVLQVVLESEASKSARSSANAMSAKRVMKTPTGSETFCTSSYKLICSPLAKCSSVTFLSSDSQYLMSVQKIIKEHVEKSFICLWPLEQTTNPEHLLIARSLVTCLASDQSGRVFAGMSDGSLAIWELREPRHLHRDVVVEGVQHTLRSPSFSSACVASTASEAHKGSVIGLHKLANNDDDTIHMASVDDSGQVIVWEVQRTYQSDLSFTSGGEGMLPGTSVKLMRKAIIVAPKGSREEDNLKSTSLEVLCSTIPDNESSNIFLGTSCGKVVRTCRYSDNSTLPVEYKSSFCEKISGVCSIAFNSVKTTTFLVSYLDGTLSLFNVQDGEPQQIWDPCDTLISEPLAIQWVRTKPSVFVVLDITSTLFFWDLDISTKPLVNYPLSRYVNN